MTSAGAQVLIKLGADRADFRWPALGHLLQSAPLWAGMGLYVIAFGLYVYLLSLYELTVISPVMIGGVSLVVFLAGVGLGEAVTLPRLAGAALVVVGVALISRTAA